MSDTQIKRADAEALLAKQNFNEIIKPDLTSSFILKHARVVKMSAGTLSMPILDALPTAGWVTDTGETTDKKPLSEAKWKDKKLNAAEMAVIIPVHENTLSDSRFNLWEEIKPLVAHEFGKILDQAAIFGTNAPDEWGSGVNIKNNSQVVEWDTSKEDISLGFNNAFGKVESGGYSVPQIMANPAMRSDLRGLRDKNNQPIYLDGIRNDGNTAYIYGAPVDYVDNGAWDTSQHSQKHYWAIGGNFAKHCFVGIREDVQVKVLDQATVGGLNLAERDMVALRFKFRVAFNTVYSTAKSKNKPFFILDKKQVDSLG